MTANVFLVEDHPIVREGVGRLIEKEPDMTICGEAENGTEALTRIERVRPDVVLVDLSLENSSGLDLIQDLRLRWPKMPVLVLSMYDEMYYAERVLRAGAMGYVMKQEAPRKIIQAIRTVLTGKLFVSEKVSDKMLQVIANPAGDVLTSPLDRLSNREIQVFQIIGEGLSNQEVADTLMLSVKTVESHIERIKDKLDIRSGRELHQRAIEWVMRARGQNV
jgi:DNA-binding NarL/FixJ family response regulator